jgi:hypothetical protein
MEDFQAAFLQRSKDVEVLDRSGRYTAAMHFGGVVIECLLKYMLLTSMPKNSRGKKEWKTDSNNPGHIIRNPLHSYERAIGYVRQYNSRLQGRIQRSPEVLKWIKEVETPDLHFIDMRYSGYEPDNAKYQQWYTAYQKLKKWLLHQLT